jgi:hypothetical protein
MNSMSRSYYDLRVKCIIAVFCMLNIAPLLVSQWRASLIMASMLLCAVGPVTHAVRSSTKAIAPLRLSIRRCTRCVLKKRNKIGIMEYLEVDQPGVGFESQRNAP